MVLEKLPKELTRVNRPIDCYDWQRVAMIQEDGYIDSLAEYVQRQFPGIKGLFAVDFIV